MPARREISAREIGAPERIVSSTVRSFRSFSSGGIAAILAILEENLTRIPSLQQLLGRNLTSQPARCRVSAVIFTNRLAVLTSTAPAGRSGGTTRRRTKE